MQKFITTEQFAKQVQALAYAHPDMRIVSIGTTSNGYYTFRCVSDSGEERVFTVYSWDK